MKTVKIPDCMNPFEVIVNNQRYSYPGGTEQEVPDEVAEVIEVHMKNYADMTAPPYVPGGGGGYSTCKVHISFDPGTYGYEVTYSTLDGNGIPTIKNLRQWFDSSEYEYDIEVVCGSFIAIGDENMNDMSVQSGFAMTKTGAGYTYCLFVPIGATSSNISISY